MTKEQEIFSRVIKTKRKTNISVFSVVICIFLALYSILLLGLIVWAIRASFLPYDYDLINYKDQFKPWGFTKDFHPENYFYALKYLRVDAFEKGGVPVYITDSIVYGFLYSFISAFMQTFCTAIVAYLTAKYDNKFSRFFHNAVLFTLVLPIAGSAASLFSLVYDMGIYDTWLAPVFMKFAFTNMYYLVFYAGFKRISWSYAESAFIDGAGHFYVFFKIMLPLVAGLFGTVMLVYFIEFFFYLILMAEYLDDLLSVHHFLDKALNPADSLLLTHEIFRGVAADLFGHRCHGDHADKHNDHQRNTEIHHNANQHQQGNTGGKDARYALRNELPERIYIVGVIAHDVAVRIRIKIFYGKILHFIEHSAAHFIKKALCDRRHELFSRQSAADPHGIQSHHGKQSLQNLRIGLTPRFGGADCFGKPQSVHDITGYGFNIYSGHNAYHGDQNNADKNQSQSSRVILKQKF